MTDNHTHEGSPADVRSINPSQRTWIRRVLLMSIVLLGLYLRTIGLYTWDEPSFRLHPDERFLIQTTSALRLPSSLSEYVDSSVSTMNPRNQGSPFFVYGMLPLSLTRLTAVALTPNDSLPQMVNPASQIDTQLTLQVPNPELGVPKLTFLMPFLNPKGEDLTGYYQIHRVGRTWSAIFDSLSILLVYLIGRRLYARRIGLLAAGLYALAVLPIQLAHFYTVDSATGFFVLLSVYWAVRVMQRGGPWSFVALGLSIGGAMACRATMASLGLLAVLAVAVRLWDSWRTEDSPFRRDVLRLGAWLIVAGLLACFTFRTLQPDAFTGSRSDSVQSEPSLIPALDPLFKGKGFFDLRPEPRFVSNLRTIGLSISGEADSPPQQQWAGRTPFVFSLQNIILWGLGLPLGLTALFSWAAAGWKLFRRRQRAHLLPWVWVTFYMAWQGGQFVMTMRYYALLYGVLCLLAAWGLLSLFEWSRQWARRRAKPGDRSLLVTVRQRLPLMTGGLLVLVVFGTLCWAYAFTRIYTQPHSRIQASRWIYDNIPPGSTLTGEQWDDSLPLSLDGKRAFRDENSPNGPGFYLGIQMTPYAEDELEKYFGSTDANGTHTPGFLDQLDQADYIILSSNRVYDSTRRLPMRYPALLRYYDTLFSGELGFELAADIHSYPTLFGIEIPTPIYAEEAFSVYDHPRVLIFKKTAAYSREKAEQLITKDVEWGEVYKLPSQRGGRVPTALRLTSEQWSFFREAGTWTALFSSGGLNAIAPWLSWLLALEVLGWAMFALLFRVLPRLPDRGFALSKTLGLLTVAYLAWLLGSTRLLAFGVGSVWLCAALLVGLAAFVGWRQRDGLRAFLGQRRAALITAEGLFLLAFFGFLVIRALNPDLWHPARGGEKPMDLAFLTAVIKSPFFPPYDPWFAGGFINYYYFGYVLVAALVHLTGIAPEIAYNLAVPSIFALTALGAWGVGYNLLAHRRAAEAAPTPHSWALERRALLGGVTAALFVVLLGPLTQAVWFLPGTAQQDTGIPAECLSRVSYAAQQACRGRTEWAFWDATRTVSIALAQRGVQESVITEFPFFTFLFADLHAHMLALPLTLAALGLMVALLSLREDWWRPRWQRALGYVGVLVPLALVIGALRATNTWDYPPILGLSVATLAILALRRWQKGSALVAALGRLVLGSAALVLLSALLFWPFTSHFATDYAGIQLWTGARTPVGIYLAFYGLWIFLLLLGAILLLRQRGVRARTSLLWISGIALLLLASVVLDFSVLLVLLPIFALALGLLFDLLVPGKRGDNQPLPSAATILPMLWATAALGVGVLVELVTVKGDIGRMNTVFKLGMQSWVYFALAGAIVVVQIFSQRPLKAAGPWMWAARWPVRVVTAVLIVAGLVYPLTATPARLADRFDPSIAPTLDGTAYMRTAGWAENNVGFALAEDADAIAWMRANISGTPIVLEAQTEGYRWGSRISIYTGLPTLLGWPWHETQQRSVAQVSPILEWRRILVQILYTSTDADQTLQSLQRYGVEYVYVGQLERALYGAAGLEKFETLTQQGRIQRVYAVGETRIYYVPPTATPSVALQSTPAVRAPASETQKSLLLTVPVGELPVVSDVSWNALARFQPLAVLFWLLACYLLQALGLPIAMLLFGRWRDGGYTWARLLALITLGYLVWLPVSMRLWSYTLGAVVLGLVLVALIDLLIVVWSGRWSLERGLEQIRAHLRQHRRQILVSEGLFLAGFAFFLVIRMLNPDLWHPIWGGEKPFEFGLLNAVLRSPVMPPYSPFFSDGIVNYYYYGFFLVSLPIKLVGVAPAIGFNLVIPTLFALTLAGGFSIVLQLAGRIRYGLFGALFLTIIGNLGAIVTPEGSWSRGLAPVREALSAGLSGFGERLGDWYFAPSRIIAGTINEFPYWSFLFADLHPHLIALPITLLAIAMAYTMLDRKRATPQQWIRHRIDWRVAVGGRIFFGALTLGALAVTNSWDFPTYGLLLAGALLGGVWREQQPGFRSTSGLLRRIWRTLAAPVLAVALGGLALFLYLPFFSSFAAQVRGIGLVSRGSPLLNYLVIYGFFFLLLVPLVIGAVWRLLETREARTPLLRNLADWAPSWVPSPARVALIVVPSLIFILVVAQPGWAWSLRVCLAALVVLGGLVLLSRRISNTTWFLIWMAVLGWMVSLGFEFIYIRDHLAGGDYYRMNTVFKFGYQVWVLLALAAAAALPRLALGLRRIEPLALAVGRVALACLIVLMMAFPLIGTPSRIANRFAGSPGLTLDGLAFMSYASYDYNGQQIDLASDAEGIQWLLEHVKGTPVVLQSSYEFYRAYGVRIAANTSLPTVVSPLHESEQRDPDVVSARDRDVATIYSTTDVDETLRLLAKYRVAYVYVGPVERVVYPRAGIDKFEQLTGSYLTSVFQNSGVTIYQVSAAVQSLSGLPEQTPNVQTGSVTQTVPEVSVSSEQRKLEQQLAANPTLANQAFALAQILINVGQQEKAAEVLAPAATANPSNTGLLHLYGDVLRDLGRDDEAEAVYRQAATAAPEAGNWNKLGVELFKMDRLDAAEEALQQAVGLDSNLPEPYFYLGQIAVRQGDTAAAIAHYTRFLELAPADSSLRAEAERALSQLQ